MRLNFSAALWLPVAALQCATTQVQAFVHSKSLQRAAAVSSTGPRNMAGGEGGESEWVKALLESTAPEPGVFEQEMKMKGLLGKNGDGANNKLTANQDLVNWLEKEGEVYLSEQSSWGEAPHPMAISTDTKDEITNESSGRGLLARRDINDGDSLLKIPLNLCLTKDSARKALGKDVLPKEINEYLAIACQLIHERYVLGDKSFYKPYIGVLPDTKEVNPTFTWSDEDLSFLEGSPVIAATKSMQMKLQREYDALLGGENGLCNKYPDRFPKEVRRNWGQFTCSRCGLTSYPYHHFSFLRLVAFYIRELDLGLHYALFSCHPTEKSQTRRNLGHGAICRSHQSLSLLSSLH
jgi:hypothetical protein